MFASVAFTIYLHITFNFKQKSSSTASNQQPVRICLQIGDERFSDSVRTFFLVIFLRSLNGREDLLLVYLGRPIVWYAIYSINISYILHANEIIKAVEETPKDKFHTINFKDGPTSIKNGNLYVPASCESINIFQVMQGIASSNQANIAVRIG